MSGWGRYKLCNTCQAVLPAAKFNRDRNKSDGLYPTCKDCRRDYRELKRRQPGYRLAALRNRAKAAGLEVTLTKADVERLTWNKPCSYCGGDLSFSGSAIDRIDSSRGYTPDNVRSCCAECNKAKGHLIEAEEFERIINERIRHGWPGWPVRYSEWLKKG